MKLQQFLEKENISVRHLAAEIGCHYQTVHNYVRKKATPTPAIAQSIVEFSKGKVTLEDLIFCRREIIRCPCCNKIQRIKKDIVE